MKKNLAPIAIIFALVAFAPAAFAGTSPGTLTVTAGVSANCTIGAATLAFGAYDPIVTNAVANLDASIPMAVACTKGVNPSIAIATAGGTITAGSGTLNYLLFSDSLRTTDFTGGFSMGAAPSKASRNVTIYGRIAGGQDVPVGAYTGTITVNVNF